DRARNPDAPADADRPCSSDRGTEPEPTRTGAEVDAVQSFVERHRFGQAPRSASGVEQSRHSTAPLHFLDSIERLESANQDSGADAASLAGDVHEPARAVRETDVSMATLEEK